MQGRGGEGRCGSALQRFFADSVHSISGIDAFMQELLYLVVGLQTLGQGGLYLCLRTIGIGDGKDTGNAVICLALEILYLTLTLYDEAYGHTLYTSC